MKKKEQNATKICKHCKSEIPADAKVCPHCRKKQGGGKLKWILLAIVVIFIIAAVAGGGDDDSSTKKVGTVSDGNVTTDTAEADTTDNSTEDSTEDGTDADADSASDTEDGDVQTVYHVGDILQDGDLEIVYMSSGEYAEDNEYMQPQDGYKYIFIQLAFENISDSSDVSVSLFSFTGYADGYNVDMYYGTEDTLSSTLSAGRSVSGYLYFEVPEDAKDIEIEYETNVFTEDKITFVYEGEQDSGYEIEANTEASADALAVGDSYESKSLKITYLQCYTDDFEYFPAKDGYHYVTCEFEFENLSDSDQIASFYDFDCYADGIDCEQIYYRDDALSATISAGRKAQGTVTYQVPDDAETVEVEYLDNVWTSDRVVFTVEES